MPVEELREERVSHDPDATVNVVEVDQQKLGERLQLILHDAITLLRDVTNIQRTCTCTCIYMRNCCRTHLFFFGLDEDLEDFLDSRFNAAVHASLVLDYRLLFQVFEQTLQVLHVQAVLNPTHTTNHSLWA